MATSNLGLNFKSCILNHYTFAAYQTGLTTVDWQGKGSLEKERKVLSVIQEKNPEEEGEKNRWKIKMQRTKCSPPHSCHSQDYLRSPKALMMNQQYFLPSYHTWTYFLISTLSKKDSITNNFPFCGSFSKRVS